MFGLSQQIEALRAYAAREGYEVLEEAKDPGQSEASLEHTGMDRVRDPVGAGGVYAMLAQDGERFARGPRTSSICERSSQSTVWLLGPSTTAATVRLRRVIPRSHHPVDVSLLSQHHSTRRPSPKRYDNLYEDEFLENFRLYQRPRGHGAPRMWRWGIQVFSLA